MELTPQQIQRFREIDLFYVLGIQNSGRVTKVLCPFHNERTASMTLYPDGGFYCFGCNAKGSNPIDWATLSGLDFYDALEQLLPYL